MKILNTLLEIDRERDITVLNTTEQGYRFRTVPTGTAGIYRTGQQSGTLDPPVSYRKKYRAYRAYRPISGNTSRYRKKFFFFFFFFLSFVIFEFLLGQNANLFVLTY